MFSIIFSVGAVSGPCYRTVSARAPVDVILIQILQTISGGSRGIGYIYGGRVVAGVGIGAISAVAPAFVSECCPKEVRGRITGFFQIMVAVGVMISYFINRECPPVRAPYACIVDAQTYSGNQPAHQDRPRGLAYPVRLPARACGHYDTRPADGEGVPAVACVEGPHGRGACELGVPAASA